jgi:hypothetical protein
MGSGARRVKRECVPAANLTLDGGSNMMYRMALPLMALLVAGGCSGSDATDPMSQTKNLSVSAAVRDANDDGEDFPRAGTFHAEKNCDQYSGLAGGFCTITVSTLKQIPVGTKVVYTDAATATAVITDLTLVPPGPGNNLAFGHVDLNRVTRTGTASFSGGTGKFQHFTASVVITYLNGRNWAWDGWYSFSSKGDED